MKDLKQKGFSAINNFNLSTTGDIEKVVSKFNIENPQELQYLMFFYIQLYFCRRGCENLDTFTNQTFTIVSDENGSESVVQNIDELTKNHRQNDDQYTINDIMHEHCILGRKFPVAIYKLYVLQLNPNSNYFWQYPKLKKLLTDNTFSA